MAQISFDQISTTNNNQGSNQVGFFSLKNDGDEAIVRFMHDTTASFDLVAVHPVTVDGRFRKVSCLRDARDPLDKCPLCEAGVKLENRFYIHLIQYDKDENGRIIPSAKVWERSISYANQLATLLKEYGPLSDSVFKIKRNGAAGSMDTRYNIMYASPQVYRPEMYPKVDAAFENFKSIGSVVMDKNYHEMVQFLQDGKFPQTNNKTEVSREMNNSHVDSYNPQTTPTASYQQTAQLVSAAPWESSSPQIQRPVRTY